MVGNYMLFYINCTCPYSFLYSCIIATNDTDFEDFNITKVQSSIEIPLDAFPADDSAYVFNFYASSILFQVVKPDDVNTTFDIVTDTEVLGFLIPDDTNITNLSMPVTITLQSMRGRNEKVTLIIICT